MLWVFSDRLYQASRDEHPSPLRGPMTAEEFLRSSLGAAPLRTGGLRHELFCIASYEGVVGKRPVCAKRGHASPRQQQQGAVSVGNVEQLLRAKGTTAEVDRDTRGSMGRSFGPKSRRGYGELSSQPCIAIDDDRDNGSIRGL